MRNPFKRKPGEAQTYIVCDENEPWFWRPHLCLAYTPEEASKRAMKEWTKHGYHPRSSTLAVGTINHIGYTDTETHAVLSRMPRRPWISTGSLWGDSLLKGLMFLGMIHIGIIAFHIIAG